MEREKCKGKRNIMEKLNCFSLSLICQMIFVPETRAGLFDIDFLENQLKVEAIKAQKKNKLLIGAFSVASNVTGISVDDIRITKLLHTYGGLSCWDYSSAASHVEIYMNPGETALTHKDAIYFSGHKFIGGPQTPGWCCWFSFQFFFSFSYYKVFLWLSDCCSTKRELVMEEVVVPCFS